MTIAARPSIPGWMASVVLGTYFGAWGFATFRALTSGSLVKWLFLLAVCSALAVLQVIALGLVDLVFLWLKIRRLPSGRSAWTGSILSAFALGVIGLAFVRLGSPAGMVASLVVPMLIVSAIMRLVTGDRC